MANEVRVPALGESVTEATVARWLKKIGDAVAMDEPIAELETDKVTLEVSAPVAGTIATIHASEGSNVDVGAVLATIVEGAAVASPSSASADQPLSAPTAELAMPAPSNLMNPVNITAASTSGNAPQIFSPAANKIASEQGLSAAVTLPASGKDGRVTKNDVLTFLKPSPNTTNGPAADALQQTPSSGVALADQTALPGVGEKRREERVPMTRLRKRIAERLKQAQDTAAILTTFNEVDMSAIMAIRGRTKDVFEKKHAVKLGFMSFFVQACVVALREVPAVNAAIEGDDIVYHSYCDIGVAVGTPQGLVVPVIRNADALSFAQIEQAITDYGVKARDGKLTMADMTGGTFTISNGGVYGSLMSTPILNPPQSAILGMHKIQERPVVIDGKIEIRPMMYLALSYDHRIIDGKEAVTFLVRVKECIEDPSRILLRM